jgi:hypothetical protein
LGQKAPAGWKRGLMDILCKLLLAHLIADFMCQWRAMLKSKMEKCFASPYLYLHGLIHYVLSLLLLWDLSWAVPLLFVVLSHIVIDGIKITFTTQQNERFLFFLDQLAHVAIIVGLCVYKGVIATAMFPSVTDFWCHAVLVFFVTFPASIFIQKIFSKWQLPEAAEESLQGVGAYIGIIERILIYLAIVTQHWNMVGFLIAAKSLFRIGEIQNVKDRRYAEYLLVGNFLSIFFATLAGVLFIYITGQSALSGS